MSMLKLTGDGVTAAESMRNKGPEDAVLALLYGSKGPIDFEEVMDELHTDEEKASMICRRLIAKGLIEEV